MRSLETVGVVNIVGGVRTPVEVKMANESLDTFDNNVARSSLGRGILAVPGVTVATSGVRGVAFLITGTIVGVVLCGRGVSLVSMTTGSWNLSGLTISLPIPKVG